MEWYDTAWDGMGWHGAAWYSMVWHGMSWLYRPFVHNHAIDYTIHSPNPRQLVRSLDPPRKQVGQSYLTSVFTTLLAGLHAAYMVVKIRPDLVLVNGPGEKLRNENRTLPKPKGKHRSQNGTFTDFSHVEM